MNVTATYNRVITYRQTIHISDRIINDEYNQYCKWTRDKISFLTFKKQYIERVARDVKSTFACQIVNYGPLNLVEVD